MQQRGVSAAFSFSVFICLYLFTGGCTTVRTTAVAQIAGKEIAFYRSGTHGPTVVFQSGLGDDKNKWAPVIEEMDSTQAVFAYDRPGYGDSQSSNMPRDPSSIARELHDLLVREGVAPPYILVGHSLGGLYHYAFARLYPQEVAGLLLLDPTHPQHWKRMQQDAPVAAVMIKLMRATVFSSAMKQEFNDQDKGMDDLESMPAIKCPARLLTRTQYDVAELGSFEKMVHSLEADWQKLLGAKKIERVGGAGHYIHHDRPGVVLAAIRALIADTRTHREMSR